jgi:SAM-dependent methyltransferase
MSAAGALWANFLATNRWISRRIGTGLPQARDDIQLIYERAMSERLESLAGPAIVVDVGGGQRCHFARFRPADGGIRIIAVDVSAEEMATNDDVDEKRVADATKEMPFEPGSVDLVASRSVLEHLPDTEGFIAQCSQVVKPGGAFVSLFSSKFSPHAIANRALPERWSTALLHALIPGSEGSLGFPAHYDRTYASEIRRLLERHGFTVTDVKVSYYQSPYYEFFVPLFIVSALYELCVWAMRRQDLAAAVVIVAERRSSADEETAVNATQRESVSD